MESRVVARGGEQPKSLVLYDVGVEEDVILIMVFSSENTRGVVCVLLLWRFLGVYGRICFGSIYSCNASIKKRSKSLRCSLNVRTSPNKYIALYLSLQFCVRLGGMIKDISKVDKDILSFRTLFYVVVGRKSGTVR